MLTDNCNIDDYEKIDPDLWGAISQEQHRQLDHIELIASENYVSQQVLQAQGSILTNKYAEGYPGNRYYGGCQFVDKIERLAIERAKNLFNTDYANVQPHSGSQANAAAYMAMCNPGDLILGMKLDHGGHLTHGAKFNFSGRNYRAIQYGIHSDSGLINYDQVAELAIKNEPKVIVAGFSSYSRDVDWHKFSYIAKSVGAYLMADISHIAGLIAAGVIESPTSIADVTTTTTHKTLRGPRGGLIMAKSNPELEKKLNAAIFPQTQGGPLLHIIAAKAVAFLEAAQPEFVAYQKRVISNAKLMVDCMARRGFSIVSGCTMNHMFVVDLTNMNMTGADADRWLGQSNITVNKNTVPNDTRSASVTSGIRIGTPAVTTRGFSETDIVRTANIISDVLQSNGDALAIQAAKEQALEICHKYPLT